MRKVVLYIAMSLDGCIADTDGGVDWLNSTADVPGNEKEESSYDAFIRDVDTVIMGWNTYHQIVMKLSPDRWVYEGIPCYVLTHREMEDTEEITFIDTPVCDLVKILRREEGKNIWICGGAQVAEALMHEDLIDRYQITVAPVILGEGIRLFPELPGEKHLRLTDVRQYGSFAELTFERREEWNVYYGESFWTEGIGKRPGRERKINRDFEWEGDTFRLLSLYVCDEGLVLDLSKKVEQEQIEAYEKKWREMLNHPGDMTESELDRCMAESPMDLKCRIRLKGDGEELMSAEVRGMGWRPDNPEQSDREAEDFLKHYDLDAEQYWTMERHSFSWIKSRGREAVGENYPKKLDLHFQAVPESVTAAEFEIWETGQKIPFTHPETGKKHVMQICYREQRNMAEELYRAEDGAGKMWEDYRMPQWYEVIGYTMTPDLPESSYTIRCRVQGEQPVPVRKKSAADAEKYTGMAATTYNGTDDPDAGTAAGTDMQIIGGASGPTAIFMAGKIRDKECTQPEVHEAFSAAFFEPAVVKEWEIVFQVRKKEEFHVLYTF